LNQVYDVTPYVEEHPGGDAILNNAGGDSTEGFFGFVTSYILWLLDCMSCQYFAAFKCNGMLLFP
jgi:cytochrome b involved in lipid metabolism